MSGRTPETMPSLVDLCGSKLEKQGEASTLPTEQIVTPPSVLRRYFDQEKLKSLASSIKEVGLLEPIVVRKIGDKYELIAGERRLQAHKIAKLQTIAVNIIECDDNTAKRIRLVENLQRQDLNLYEETIGILELLTILLSSDQEEVVQLMYKINNETKSNSNQNVLVSDQSLAIQELFSKLGRITWQSFVTTRLPLLKLADDIKDVLLKGELEYTKALAISKIKDMERRALVLRQAIDEKLSLSQIKELVEADNLKEKGTISTKEITTRLNKISAFKKNKTALEKIFQNAKKSK